MDDKYKESLRRIKNYCLYWAVSIKPGSLLDEDFNTLQELIDNNERNEESIKLKNLYILKLEKALKRACELLSSHKICIDDVCSNKEYKTVSELEEYFIENADKEYVGKMNSHEETLADLLLKCLNYPREEWKKLLNGK